jgi:hypothetical protein
MSIFKKLDFFFQKNLFEIGDKYFNLFEIKILAILYIMEISSLDIQITHLLIVAFITFFPLIYKQI